MSTINVSEEAPDLKKEQNEDFYVSDGEIIDEPTIDESPITMPSRKLQKNFRARQSDNSEESEDNEGLLFKNKLGQSFDKHSKEANKLKAKIENGNEKYLQTVRKNIISELREKDNMRNIKKYSSHRGYQDDDLFKEKLERSNKIQSSRFNFKRNRNFQRNSFHERSENGKTDLFEVKTKGKFHLYFPKSCIKYTTTKPTISYAENPRAKQKNFNSKKVSNSRNDYSQDLTSKIEFKKITKNKAEKLKKEMRRSKIRKNKQSSASKDFTKIEKEPNKFSSESNNDHMALKLEKKLDVVENSITNEESDFSNDIKNKSLSSLSVDKKSLTPSPKRGLNNESSWKLKLETISTPEQKEVEERIKIEPIIIERKKIRKIEKPKVNIFLEDSDEVDEFENSLTLEVKSKWSSPDPQKLTGNFEDEYQNNLTVVPKNSFENLIDIPMVVDSPEKSPITTGSLTDSLFDTPSSISLCKSSTTQIKNVCSFLTDIESEGYLSSFSLQNEFYDDEEGDLSSIKNSPAKNLFSFNQEPDTTVDKLENKLSLEKDLYDLEGDSDDDSNSESNSSSSSSTSSSSESSEESSDESSDDETSKIVNIFSGFGRFDAKSMPMVTQIKTFVSENSIGTTENLTTRFQPQQSIIKPPGLVTNLIKPPLYTTGSCTTAPFPSVSAYNPQQFPIPFKIYSLRDAGNNGMLFPSVQPTPVPVLVDKAKERERTEKKSEKRERDRHRSRSHSRERDRKKTKDDRKDYDRKKTPPSRKTPSPRRASISPRRKHTDLKRDTKRRDLSPKHNSHRISHGSRHSPIRRNRRLSRGRTPPQKIRRISPASKYQRNSSPSYKHSPSPIYHRSPRRRYSSPLRNNEPAHSRRTSSKSPNDYERHDIHSPKFRKIESPSNTYKPDSTISDTELEHQQHQFTQMGDYYSSWNSSIITSQSPCRQNLDDRINRMLSDSPTPGSSYQDGSYPYPQQIHDTSSYLHDQMNHHHEFYYSDNYTQNHSFIPPVSNMESRYQQPIIMNSHGQQFEENFSTFSSSRGFVNNSNLVEITQQKREKQRIGSNQIAVQVGNVLEIVPSKMPSPPQQIIQTIEPKPLSLEEIKQQVEKKEQLKNRRKAERERRRMAKYLRKEKLRQEIQKYFDAGINIEDSDDETLIRLRPINTNAIVERGIIKNTKTETENKSKNDSKKVLFKDGIMPGETSSDNEILTEDENIKVVKLKLKRMRKRRMSQFLKNRKKNVPIDEIQMVAQKQDQLDTAPPPSAPSSLPSANLKQPKLKNITPDMFAAFAVNVDPIYYYIHKMQIIQNENTFQVQSRQENRYSYQKYNDHSKHHNVQYPLNYPSQQRHCVPSKLMNSMDPRINQQRSADKTYA